MYAFVSNDEMSAGLWSNSEFEGRNAGASSSGGSNNTRVMSVSEKKERLCIDGTWKFCMVLAQSDDRFS